jgi:uncharacterized protein
VVNTPPIPWPDQDTKPFWEACAQRRLMIQHCEGCKRWIWQPKPVCPRCHAAAPTWTPVSGDARVVSWTVVHPPVLPVWEGATPFVILLVELDDAPGARLIGQLVDNDGTLLQTDGRAEGLHMAAPVSLRWRVDEAGTTLPVWALR